GRRGAGFDGEELGNEIVLVDVQALTFEVAVPPRSDFGCAAMVEHASLPGVFDPLADGRDRSPWLAGQYESLDVQVGDVDLVFTRRSGQVQGIARCAEKCCGAAGAQQLEPCERSHAAAGHGETAARAGRVERAPESDERPK